MPIVRRAVVDGLFYPDAREVLRAQVVDYLAGVGADDDDSRSRPKLLITPHAGYEYCGAVAAHAYALLGARREPIISRVVLLGRRIAFVVPGLATPEAMPSRHPWAWSALDIAALAGLDELPQVASQRPRARARALAGGSVAVPADAARQFHPRPLVVGDAGAEAVRRCSSVCGEARRR